MFEDLNANPFQKIEFFFIWYYNNEKVENNNTWKTYCQDEKLKTKTIECRVK